MEIENPRLTGTSQGFGVPTAGTSGQVLQKIDGTNYNTQWVDTIVNTIELRRTAVYNIANQLDYVINWDIIDTGTLSALNLSQSSGIFTNTGTKTRHYSVSFMSGIASGNNITESNMYITKNGTFGFTNRIAMSTQLAVGATAALQHVSTIITLAPNDTFRCYHYCTTVGAIVWALGLDVFGHGANYSTRLKITEIK